MNNIDHMRTLVNYQNKSIYYTLTSVSSHILMTVLKEVNAPANITLETCQKAKLSFIHYW